MGRYRSRTHYGQLRRFDMAKLPPVRYFPAERWDVRADWADGSSIRIRKEEHNALLFEYAVGEHPVSHRVPLTFVLRHFGGEQPYLRCPSCMDRCRLLFFVGTALRCRRCIRAIYYSQSVDASQRALLRFRKLRERIRSGIWDAELSYFPRRPKRMRRATYERIKADALAAFERYDAITDASLGARLVRLMARTAPDALASLLE
jgi:hypothetical protein